MSVVSPFRTSVPKLILDYLPNNVKNSNSNQMNSILLGVEYCEIRMD
jgi:hypothetical protein